MGPQYCVLIDVPSTSHLIIKLKRAVLVMFGKNAFQAYFEALASPISYMKSLSGQNLWRILQSTTRGDQYSLVLLFQISHVIYLYMQSIVCDRLISYLTDLAY